jgi:hypothetical protein
MEVDCVADLSQEHIASIIRAVSQSSNGKSVEQFSTVSSTSSSLLGIIQKFFTNWYVRLEVLTAVKMLMFVFWVMTPFRLVGRYQRFGGTYCLHLQG